MYPDISKLLDESIGGRGGSSDAVQTQAAIVVGQNYINKEWPNQQVAHA